MNLVDRVKNIITNPKAEWVVIEGEEPNTGQILTGYVLPLALIPAIASIIGGALFGRTESLVIGIVTGVAQFIVAFVSVYIASLVINLLASSFSSQKNFGRALQLVAYSFTPFWVGGILQIIPIIGVIGALFGLYGLYLLYLGFPHTMKTPEDKVIIYLIISVVVIGIVWGIIYAIMAAIVVAIGVSMLAMGG